MSKSESSALCSTIPTGVSSSSWAGTCNDREKTPNRRRTNQISKRNTNKNYIGKNSTKRKNHHHRGNNNKRFKSHHRQRNLQQQNRLAALPVKYCSVCTIENNPKYKCPKCRQSYCSIDCCKKHKEELCSRSSTCSALVCKDEVDERQQEELQPMDSDTGATSHGSIVKKHTSKYMSSTELESIMEFNEDFNNTYTDGERLKHSAASDDEGVEDDDDDEGWKITQSMMDSIKESEWLRAELQDVGLQHIIKQIVSASKRVYYDPNKKKYHNRDQCKDTIQELFFDEQKERYPMFQQFLDRLLVISGVLEEEEDNLHNSNTYRYTTTSSVEEWILGTRKMIAGVTRTAQSSNEQRQGILRLKPLPGRNRSVEVAKQRNQQPLTMDEDEDEDDEDEENNSATSSNDDDDDASDDECAEQSSSSSDGSTSSTS